MTKLYGTIWGHCSPALQSEVIGDKDYKEKSPRFDYVGLLSKLQKLCSGLDAHSNAYVATHSAEKSFFTIRQKENECLETYHRRFESAVDTLRMSLGSLFHLPDLLVHEQDTFIHSTNEEAKERREAKYLAVAFIQGAYHQRYAGI